MRTATLMRRPGGWRVATFDDGARVANTFPCFVTEGCAEVYARLWELLGIGARKETA